MEQKSAVHSQIQRDLQSLYRIVAATSCDSKALAIRDRYEWKMPARIAPYGYVQDLPRSSSVSLPPILALFR
jgi:hypothetical protein